MYLKIILFNLLVTLTSLTECNGARILAIVPTPSFSHQVAFRKIWKELSLRGHQVTLLTTNPMKDKSLTNLTEIDLSFNYESWNKNVVSAINIGHDQVKFAQKLREMLVIASDLTLEHSQVKELIKNQNNQKFDLVLAEYLHPIMYAFAEIYKCPFIGIASFETFTTAYHSMGNPAHPVLHPDVTLPLIAPLSFKERVLSTLYVSFLNFYISFFVFPQEARFMRKHFGEDFADAREIRNKMSMLFINTDPIFNVIRPLVPAVVHIGGGSYIDFSTPLPQNLQKLLDDEKNGVIYFSLGTNVKSANVRPELTNLMLETFAELPYKILCKFDTDLPNKSSNVITSKWFPQRAILKHSNVKLFITQGGWQSIEESIYSHTPMLGIPFFGDQPNNINSMVHKGIALSLDFTTMTKDDFKRTILELIENPKYSNKIKELAKLAQDQPMTGVEKAVWWAEYVIRHKGAYHLRYPGLDLPFYQYYLLDVIAFFVFVLAVVCLLVVFFFKIVFKLVNYVTSRRKLKTL